MYCSSNIKNLKNEIYTYQEYVYQETRGNHVMRKQDTATILYLFLSWWRSFLGKAAFFLSDGQWFHCAK